MYRRGFQGAMLLVVLLFMQIAHAQTSSDMCLMAFEKGFNRCAIGKLSHGESLYGVPYATIRNGFFSNPYFYGTEYCAFKAEQAMDDYYLSTTMESFDFIRPINRATQLEVLKHALQAYSKCLAKNNVSPSTINPLTGRNEDYWGHPLFVYKCALDHYSQCLLSNEHNFEKLAPFSATCMGRKNAMYINITNQGEKRAIKFPLYFERTPEDKLLDALATEDEAVVANTELGYNLSFIQRGQDYMDILNKIEDPKQRLAEASKFFSPEELANGEMEWWTQRHECVKLKFDDSDSNHRDKCDASNFYHQHSKKNSNMMLALRQLCLKRPNHVRRTLYYSCQDYPGGKFLKEGLETGPRYDDDAVYLCDKETGNAEKDKETCYNLYETGSQYWEKNEKRIRTLKRFLCQPSAKKYWKDLDSSTPSTR